MKRKYFSNLGVVLALMFFLTACGEKKPDVDATKEKASAESAAKEKEALETSIEAYILCLSAGDDGVHTPGVDQHRGAGGHQGADGPVRAACENIPTLRSRM